MAVSFLPTLIIGIGGIGCRIGADISNRLSLEEQKFVSVIGMDTNVEDIRQLNADSMSIVRTSDESLVRDYLKRHPEYNAWVPDNRFIKLRSMNTGAGQIRMLSRMAALASEERGDFEAIKREIQRITVANGDRFAGTLTVMIVGSNTGGTGAGLFLQLPYYIRQVVKQNTGIAKVTIRGMFMGPDVTASVQPTDINKAAVRVNAYSCIKELNALYMRQSDSSRGSKLDLEHYNDNKDEIPYDYLYLIEGATAGSASIEEMTKHVARMVHTLMFTPVHGRTESDADNFVLPIIGASGMNRYASAGLCRLYYPQEDAVSYVTRKLVKDLVKEEWTVIDKAVTSARRNAFDNQKHDPNVKIPEIGEQYLIQFKTYTNEGEGLASLRNEAYFLDDNGELVSLASKMMKRIRERAEGITNEGDFIGTVSNCVLNSTNARSLSTAEEAFEDAQQACKDLVSKTKELCDEYRYTIVDDIFPTTMAMLEDRKNRDDNIYQWFSDKHPVVARFLTYDLISRLKKRENELGKAIEGTDIESFNNYDFSPAAGEQNLKESLELIRFPEKTRGLISRVVFKSDAKELNKLANDVTREMSTLVSNCTDYLRYYLELETCIYLRARMECLSKQYESFFDTIGTNISDNDRTLSSIEKGYTRIRLGEEPVYCSREAFQQMYELYKPIATQRLAPETRQAIFRELYKITSSALNDSHKALTEEGKQKANDNRRRELNLVFERAVVDTLRTDVLRNSSGTVCMNVRQALEKEMLLADNVNKDSMPDNEYEAVLKHYTQSRIITGFGRAEPMINASYRNGALVYLALNPDCAEMRNGLINEADTVAMLQPAPQSGTSNQVAKLLIDEEFSPQEMVCFRTHYLFQIEELQQYTTGSENEKEYHKRIHDLRTKDPNSITNEELITVINPHLDQRWHELAYIPSLLPDEREKERKDLHKAFFFGLAMGAFTKQLDEDKVDDILIWHYKGQPIKIFRNEFDGRHGTIYQTIGASYTALFNSLKYNGLIVADILKDAKAWISRIGRGKDIEDILEYIQNYTFANQLSGDENVFDVLLQMRESLEDRSVWPSLFESLREVIWIYCSGLLEGRVRDVNRESREMIKRLCLASKVGFLKDENGELAVDENQTPQLSEEPKRGAARMQEPIAGMLRAEYERESAVSYEKWNK